MPSGFSVTKVHEVILKNGGKMKNNVINLMNREQSSVPDDLMTFKEIESKYKIKYQTLYKYTKTLKEIPVYTRGGLRVSERDVIEWLNSGLEPARG